jgi:nucleoside 2-deoxyribosyltransferase
MITIYVAGPIDRAEKKEAGTWREKLRSIVGMGCDLMLFDPFASFTIAEGAELDKQHMALISRTNRTFLAGADYALFYLAGESPAFGTIREIEYCAMLNIPMVVVGHEHLMQHVEAHDLTIVNDLNEALDVITKWKAENPVVEKRSIEDQNEYDPTFSQVMTKAKPPPQEHPQQPISDSYADIVTAIAAILDHPAHMHYVNGEYRKLITVDTIVYSRAINRIENGLCEIVTGKYDDGFRFIELIEK